MILRRVQEILHPDGRIETVEIYLKSPEAISAYYERQRIERALWPVAG